MSYRGFHRIASHTAARSGPLLSSMLDVEFAQLSDPGRVRHHNEDCLGFSVPNTPEEARSQGWLFALADGVGGHRKGEVASKAAVESLLEGFRKADSKVGSRESPSAQLTRMVQAANAHVFETAVKAGTSGAGMATTLVACTLRFDRAVVAHVGDSRCYLVRSQHARLLTRDHTVANEHVRLGLISAREAAEGDTRHVLSRSLGSDLFVSVETNDVQVIPGDVLLLCSDGLHGAVSAAEMTHIVGHHDDLNFAAHELIELANEHDGGDNVSVQLIRVRKVERMGMYRGRPYKLG